MSLKTLPTLSSNGWVTDPNTALDMLLNYFLSSEYSQTYFFNGEVKSLKYLLVQHSKDLNTLISHIETSLIELLESHFDEDTDSVSVDAHYEVENDSVYNLKLKIEISTQGTTISNNKNFIIKNDQLIDLIQYTNIT